MSKNVNVFIGVLLCAVLCGTFVWLSSSGDESSWSPNDIYNEVQGAGSVGGYATTSATFSGPSNEGGVALPMSSSSMRARSSYKYAGAYSGAAAMPLTSSPLSSSASLLPSLQGGVGGRQALYTTSSAEIKSFGGGGNGGAAMGGSARSAAMSNSQSPVVNGAMGMSPITYTAARVKNTPSVDPATVSSGDMMAVMAANYGMGGYTSAVYAGNFSGTYDQYVGIYSSSNSTSLGISGRRESGALEDAWTSWLLDWYANTGNTSPDIDGDGVLEDWEFNEIYEALSNSSNTGMGMLPTEEDVREFLGQMLPVGDIVPLLLLALLYVLFVAIKFNFFKSFLKTKRSE